MRTFKNVLIGALVLLLVASVVIALHFYQVARQCEQTPQQTAEQAVRTLVTEVSQLMTLPDNELPTVLTVTDLEKLKGQPFFVKAKVGDKVLIYSTAKKAILYDPVAHKILEVAPLNDGSAPPSSPATAPTTSTKR